MENSGMWSLFLRPSCFHLAGQPLAVPRHHADIWNLCSYRVCRAELSENGGDFIPSGLHRGAPGADRGGLRPPPLEVAAAHGDPAQLLLSALLLVSPPGTKKEGH